ncbi:MAG: aldehyde:ferredoxin oxidoreductase [Tepidanaerobacteraceae bacterium]|nr:aldehyde:ferredoxin oxidoreductase [Tepidanaerobacteraceae bacterium]
MPFGFTGKILKVDLDTGEIGTVEVPPALYKEHLGGSGLAARILYEDGVYKIDPLGPKNQLIFMNGILTGTPAPASCKMSICAKSPLTGLWGESTVGGFFGAELKKTPYDGIIINGKAQRPVYILIENEKAQISDATDVWGLDTYSAFDYFKRRFKNDKFQMACIGPAGEKLVKISSIMIGGYEARAAARTGMGAVMGSKNLKAIIVKASGRPQIADKARLISAIREDLNTIISNTKVLHDFGTAGGLQSVEAFGDLPVRNWSMGSWEEGAAKICGQYIAKAFFVSHSGCHACPIRCGKNVKILIGPYKGTVAHGPEYETCAGFGSNLLNDDINVIIAANDLCNRYGLDTISTSGVIAWAMECFEAGLLTKKDTDGIVLTWGNKEAILKVIKLIADNKGFGQFLGQGVKLASTQLGGLAREFAVETKGLEYAFHDPRAFTSMAVNYATANRGACHLEALSYFAEQSVFPPWLSAVIGETIDENQLMKIGERNFNLKRIFNYKLGITRKDDCIPPRLGMHDRKTGLSAGSIPHLGKLLVEYYRLRGWSEEGVPRKEKLKQLSLSL